MFCVLAKPKYTIQHVERLYGLLDRYLSREFNLVCLTDQTLSSDLPISFINVREYELDTWWNKVLIFQYANYGLYFDLDVDIKKNIDFLLEDIENGKICVVDTPWKDKAYFEQTSSRVNTEAFLCYGNTSVMGWRGNHTYLVSLLFENIFKHVLENYGDDTFINRNGKIKYFRREIDSAVGELYFKDPAILIHYQPKLSVSNQEHREAQLLDPEKY